MVSIYQGGIFRATANSAEWGCGFHDLLLPRVGVVATWYPKQLPFFWVFQKNLVFFSSAVILETAKILDTAKGVMVACHVSELQALFLRIAMPASSYIARASPVLSVEAGSFKHFWQHELEYQPWSSPLSSLNSLSSFSASLFHSLAGAISASEAGQAEWSQFMMGHLMAWYVVGMLGAALSSK